MRSVGSLTKAETFGSHLGVVHEVCRVCERGGGGMQLCSRGVNVSPLHTMLPNASETNIMLLYSVSCRNINILVISPCLERYTHTNTTHSKLASWFRL